MGSLGIRNLGDDILARLKRWAAKHGQSAEAEARAIPRHALAADILLEPTGALMEPALAVATTLGHPAYDCIYLALAAANEGPLVTADEVLVRRARSAGVPVEPIALQTLSLDR